MKHHACRVRQILLSVAVLGLTCFNISEAQNADSNSQTLETPPHAKQFKLHATVHTGRVGPIAMIIEEMSYTLIFEEQEPVIMLKVKGRKKLSDGSYSLTPELMFLDPQTEFTLQVYDTITGEKKNPESDTTQ